MKKPIIILIVILTTFLLAETSFAASWYLRKGATGSNNGSSWANAWNEMNQINWSNVKPGDTVWLAGGTYTTMMSVEVSGSSGNPIYIKRVRSTDAVPVGATGWNSSFDSQVYINTGDNTGIRTTGSYIVIDGQIDSGIKIIYGVGDKGGIDSNGKSNVLRYIELQGPGVGYNYTGPCAVGIAVGWTTSVDGLLISHVYIHGSETLIQGGGPNIIIEYSKLADSSGNSVCHGNVAFIGGSTSVNGIFRYNDISNMNAEGIYFTGWDGSPGNWKVYGNVFHDSSNEPNTWGRGIEIQEDYSYTGIEIYSNTFVNLSGGGFNNRPPETGHTCTNCIARDNLSYNATNEAAGMITSNNVDDMTNRFVNLSAGNYHLAAPLAGTNFLATDGLTADGYLNKDLDGNTRGADGVWDIGAYEYIAGETVLPQVSMTAPSGGAILSGSSVTVSATATDNVAVAKVQFKLDGANLGSAVTSATSTFQMSWDTTQAGNGAHSLTAVATDTSGNTATSNPVNVTVSNVDTTPPLISAGTPSGVLAYGTTSATLSVTTNEDATCKYGTTPGLAYASMPNTFTTTGAKTHSANLTGLTNGSSYSYCVRCKDTSNNVNTSDYPVNFSVSATAIDPALVGWWKLDEGVGTTAADASGNGNNGTLTNGSTWATGQIGSGALNFDGTDDFVDVPASVSLEPPSLSVQAWIKGGVQGSYAYLIAKGASNCDVASYAFDTGSNGGLEFYIADSSTTNIVSPNAGTGVWTASWHHVVGTYDGSSVRLYVDGAEVGSGTVASKPITYGLPTHNRLTIGAYSGSCSLYFKGSLDDVRIYNRALSASEIQALYNSGTTPTILYGDVSGDGKVSAYDAALVGQYAVSLITLTPEQITRADVSGDGKVSAYDAALIAQYAVGLISKFPVEG